MAAPRPSERLAAKKVAALQSLDRACDFEQRADARLSRERQAALNEAVAEARAEGSVTAVRLLTRDGASVFSAGDQSGSGVSSVTPLGAPGAPSARLAVESPGHPEE